MMFENKKLLKDVFVADENGEKYIIFEHRQKTWVMPEANLEPAFSMYQPATCKGRLLKVCIYRIKNIKLLLRLAGCQRAFFSVNPQVVQYIDENINKEAYIKGRYYISGYMGDMSSEDNNKVTLQVYGDDKILLYAKVSKSGKVEELFDKEISALAFLKSKGVKNIPIILSLSKSDGIYMFLQDTRKDISEKVSLIIDERHMEFLKNITESTGHLLNYEDTDFYGNVWSVKKQIEKDKGCDVLKEAVRIVESRLNGRKDIYAFAHGDYTPWNMYYSNKEIYPFDFEYCDYSMPCYIDIFHYITQMSLLGYGNSAEKTISLYEEQRKMLEKYMEDTDFTYLCYLINIIGFYKKRTVKTNEVVDKEYDEWILIAKYLIEKVKQKTLP